MNYTMIKCYTCDHRNFFKDGKRSCNELEITTEIMNIALDEAIQICNEAIEDIDELDGSGFVTKGHLKGRREEAIMLREAIKKLKEE